MSRSKLDQLETRYSYKDQKRSKTPTELDSFETDPAKRRNGPYESNQLDYNHYDQQYAAYTQNLEKGSDYSLQRRITALEEKMTSIDHLNKQSTMFDRKLEELALQFDKFLSNPSDRHKNTGFHESIRSDIDHRMKQVEDRCEMINSKIDKGLLILQRDLQDFERANQSKLREMIENVVGPSLADLAESIKGQTLDIEEIRLQSQQLIKQVQGELIQKISELREPDSYSKQASDYQTPDRTSPYQAKHPNELPKPQVNHQTDVLRARPAEPPVREQYKYARSSRGNEEMEFEYERQQPIEKEKHFQPPNYSASNISSSASANIIRKSTDENPRSLALGEMRNKNLSFAAEDQELRQRNEAFPHQNDYDETRKKIDDEINRRLMEENEKRRTLLQKENEARSDKYEQQVWDEFDSHNKFKHTPMSTEKSRSKEIQNRLNLERKTKQEKINQLNEYSQYKRK